MSHLKISIFWVSKRKSSIKTSNESNSKVLLTPEIEALKLPRQQDYDITQTQSEYHVSAKKRAWTLIQSIILITPR